MTLADYLEGKAEYIFDNYLPSFYYVEDPQDLKDNRKIIIDTLKEGLRELAKIHDDSFSSRTYIKKHEKNEFEGWVYVYWVERSKVHKYTLHVKFPHWSFAKIMLEEINKKFEHVFTVDTIIYSDEIKKTTRGKRENTSKKIFKFKAEGWFLHNYYPNYLDISLLFLNPSIAEFHKSNMFSMFKDLDIKGFLFDHNYTLREYNYGGISFGDFIIMNLESKYANHTDDFSKHLLISKKPKEAGFYAIRLTDEEYTQIVTIIKNIKETKKVNDRDIFLEDLLSKYAYLKIIKDINT